MTAASATSVPRPRRTDVAARVWNGVLAAIVLASLVVQLALLFAGGTDANSGVSGSADSLLTRLIRFFSYFTIQSNLFVLAVSITLAWRPDRDGPGWRVARLDALLGIVITGLIFATILAPKVHVHGAAAFANAGFHYISPALAIIGWLAFGPRPRITWSALAWAFAWPAAWIGYTFAHGAVTGWYPYGFVSAALHGYPVALRNTLLVVVLAALIGCALRFGDRRLPARPGVVPRTPVPDEP